MMCIACAAAALDRGGVTLTRKESSPVPVEADSICPDRFAALGPNDIARLPAFYGRRQVTLGDLFEIEGAGAMDITVTGDLAAVKKIGHGMTMGRVTARIVPISGMVIWKNVRVMIRFHTPTALGSTIAQIVLNSPRSRTMR